MKHFSDLSQPLTYYHSTAIGATQDYYVFVGWTRAIGSGLDYKIRFGKDEVGPFQFRSDAEEWSLEFRRLVDATRALEGRRPRRWSKTL